jgi:hypothetical protein
MPTPDLYTYLPPKGNRYGHVPFIKDNARIFTALREFVSRHARLDVVDGYLDSPGESDLDRNLVTRFSTDLVNQFGIRDVVGYFRVPDPDRDRFLDYIATVTAWPEWSGSDVSFAIGFNFVFRSEADVFPPDLPPSTLYDAQSHLVVTLGCRQYLRPQLVARSLATLKKVEAEFTDYRLFRLNPAHYRLNGRKLKPGI